MTLRERAKELLHVWSYDFYDTTLSTEKQRRHMINQIICFFYFPYLCMPIKLNTEFYIKLRELAVKY